MRTLRGLIDKVSWSPPSARIFFDGEVYTVPDVDPSWAVEPAIRWLSMARQWGFPVTLEVDEGSVILGATIEVEGHTLRFEGPSLTMRLIKPGNAP
jgi:hypothetical protein